MGKRAYQLTTAAYKAGAYTAELNPQPRRSFLVKLTSDKTLTHFQQVPLFLKASVEDTAGSPSVEFTPSHSFLPKADLHSVLQAVIRSHLVVQKELVPWWPEPPGPSRPGCCFTCSPGPHTAEKTEAALPPWLIEVSQRWGSQSYADTSTSASPSFGPWGQRNSTFTAFVD